MQYRHIGWLAWLLVFVAMGFTGQDPQQATDQGSALAALLPPQDAQPDPKQAGELPPLPPNPADWVCQDSLSVVSPAAIDAWCSTNVNRGLPTPTTLQIPPPLADLLAKDIFDVASKLPPEPCLRHRPGVETRLELAVDRALRRHHWQWAEFGCASGGARLLLAGDDRLVV